MSETIKDEHPKQSTGPTSIPGKEKSSRNASTHGLCCEKFFLLPDEKQEDFDALAQTLAEEYKDVASPGLAPLLKNLVEALWLQNRAYRKIAITENAIYFHEQNREFDEAEKTFKRLFLMQRYKTSYENSYQRALRAIEAFRKARIAEFMKTIQIEKAAHAVVKSRLKTLEPLEQLGRYTDEELDQKLEKLYSWSSSDTPYWSPQRFQTANSMDTEPETSAT